MTAIVTNGIELSARTQVFLLSAELITLAAFAVVALWKVYVGDAAPAPIIRPLVVLPVRDRLAERRLTAGMLLAVFIYWGWDSAGRPSTRRPRTRPRRRARRPWSAR